MSLTAGRGRIYDLCMQIVIMDYQRRWAEEYAAIEQAIKGVVGPEVQRIDHIGSTSVPGLAAKDIIDIQLSVTAIEPVEVYGKGLESLGYFEKPGNLERNKRYFRESGGMRRTHIHIRESGAFGQQFALLFRDYLRASPEECEYYAAQKRELAKQEWENVSDFGDAKDPLFWEIMRRANAWQQDTAWRSG